MDSQISQSRYFRFALKGFFLSGAFFLTVLFSGDAGATLWEALSQGKVVGDLRYRYERVDQENIATEANASTLRTRLGYETRPYNGWNVFLEFENIVVVGDERYNSTANGKTQFPVVADPKDTEVNQAFLKYQSLGGSFLKGGRQRIILDDARFVGNVGWRQNEQTFDSVSVGTPPGKTFAAYYAYVFNVNRIFGNHHPLLSDLGLETHLFHLSLRPDQFSQVSGYTYLLDFDDLPEASTKTFGVRLKGMIPISETVLGLYNGEYANQSEYSDGAETNDAIYWSGGGGVKYGGTTLSVLYEVLEGDGIYAFSTPLATLHAFQGWTDRFFSGAVPSTPLTGVRDLSFSLASEFFGLDLTAVYHYFSSDQNDFDYGTELGLEAVKEVGKGFSMGIKYADYDPDPHPSNTGLPAIDMEILWLTAQLKF